MEGEGSRARDTVGTHLERLLGAIRAGALGKDSRPMETLAEPTPLGVDRALAGLEGTLLGERYELGRLLGAGGMGAVFEGRDLRLERRVAIKVIKPALARDTDYTKRFLREAQAASKIRHRNVVVVLDYGEVVERGLVYSVMELLAGQDLQALLYGQPEQRLPWARACGLLVQIASGLKAAHGEGIIHRDIKPANCFLTQEDGDPVVKLVDFGIAKLEHAEQQLTSKDLLIGTPSYIAPELMRTQDRASPRSDVYSLGVVAYRMLTGGLPFTGETSFEVMRRACMDPVPSLCERVPDLPMALDELVQEMLAKKPEDRPADMGVVRQRLQVLDAEAASNSSSAGDDDDEARALEATEEHTTVPRNSRRQNVQPLDPEAESTQPSDLRSEMVDLPSTAVRPGDTLPVVNDLSSGGSEEFIGPHQRRTGLPSLVAPAAGLVVAAIGAWWWTMPGEVVESPPSTDTIEFSVEAERADGLGVLVRTDMGEAADIAEGKEYDPIVPLIHEEAAVEVAPLSRTKGPPSAPTGSALTRRRMKQRSPDGPPLDGELRQTIERKIRMNCKGEIASAPVTLMFIVTKEGRTSGLTAIPKNAAGDCAKRQLGDLHFQRRDEDTDIEIVVE